VTQRNLFETPPIDIAASPTLTPRERTLVRAARRARAGQRRAGDHAERVRAGWIDAACAAVVAFAVRQASPWLLEQARTHAEAQGLPAPPDKRAWGAVSQTLKRRGQIASVGYAPAASSNGSPKCLWAEGPRKSRNHPEGRSTCRP
jgi:hypothetical protein